MRRRRRRSLASVASLVLALVGGALISACSSSPASPPTRPAAAAPSIPFNTTLATPPGTWVVVPMGDLNEPANTFWELFFRASGATKWSLVTPPGVALNGGLTIAAAAGLLTAGIEPTNLLTYSPLAQRDTKRNAWAPGIVPGALIADPDALASSAGQGLLAVLRGGSAHTAEVVQSAGSVLSWTDLVSETTLEHSGGGSSCQVSSLTSVAFASGGARLVGADCSKPGVVGIFAGTAGSWVLEGPRLTGALAAEPASVLRLWSAGPRSYGVASLIAAGSGATADLVAAWGHISGAPWTMSPALVLAGARIVSSGITEEGEIFAVVRSSSGSLQLETIVPGGQWQETSGLPAGTAAVSIGSGGVVDALAVTGTTLFTDWQRSATTGAWGRLQSMRVPVPFGSSS